MATVYELWRYSEMNYSITSKTGTTRTPTSRRQSRTPMTTLTSTIAWRTCTESARTAHLFHSCDCLTLHIPCLKYWAFSHSIHGHYFIFPPVCLRLPLPLRAVPWSPLHEGHGKPALLRCRKEWGHPERPQPSHRSNNWWEDAVCETLRVTILRTDFTIWFTGGVLL